MRFSFYGPPAARLRVALAAIGFVTLPGLAAAQVCPDYTAPAAAQIGYAAGQLASPQALQVVAGGSIDMMGCSDIAGAGHVAPAPNFELTLSGTQPGTALVLRATADCDTTLLVNDSTGAWSYGDDSGASFDPEVRVPAADGVYDIWVGTFEPATCKATFSLQVVEGLPTTPGSAACPDAALTGAPLTYGAAELATLARIDVVAGGELDLGGCADVPGLGHVATAPDFELNLSGATAATTLVIGVDSTCDAVLLVNDATGTWQYADDTNGTNPAVTLTGAIDGTYDIWAGTFGPDLCEAQLTLQTQGAGGTVAPPPKPRPGEPAVQTPAALPDPGNLMEYRDSVGQSFTFAVTGTTLGSVWGSGIYTDDSVLAAAAVHAGLLQPGQAGTVTVTILGPQDSFAGSPANGVTSSDYGAWYGSYRFEGAPAVEEPAAPDAPAVKEPAAPAAPPAPAVEEPAAPDAPAPVEAAQDPGNLVAFRDQVGQTLAFTVTGSDFGGIWGSGIYTDDSDLGVAAVHAGILQVGQTGVVQVQILGPQASFTGSEANGVTSRDFGAWGGSFSVVP